MTRRFACHRGRKNLGSVDVLPERKLLPRETRAAVARKFVSHAGFGACLIVGSRIAEKLATAREPATWHPFALSLSQFLAMASAGVAAPITHLVPVEVIKA